MSHATQYPPVGPFEKATGYCPLYIAINVTDEVENYFHVRLPDSFSDQLAEKAEKVFAHSEEARRRFKGRRGLDWLYAFMRHWLAALFWKQRRDLFNQLPESFKIGHPLPAENPAFAERLTRRPAPKPTHTCDVVESDSLAAVAV